MVACAIEPRMSWSKSFLSKPMEAFISSMIASGPEAKRPPHIWLEEVLSLLPSAMACSHPGEGHDKEKPVRPPLRETRCRCGACRPKRRSRCGIREPHGVWQHGYAR